MHDFNGRIDPLFWTVRIPDGALSVGPGGSVRLHAEDLPVVDSFTLFGETEVPATVSFDVTWTRFGKVRHLRPGSSDPTDPANFAGEFRFATSMGTFSGSNANGFSFTATATSDFAEIGTERNGFFLK